MPKYARSDSAYSFKRHGTTSRKQGRLGDYVLKNSSGCEVWTPSWNHTTTVVRPLGVPSLEDASQWCEFRRSDEPDDFDDWIRGYPAVRSWGDPGVTFILYDPTDDSYDIDSNPAWVLWRCVDGQVSSGQAPAEWKALTERGQNRGAMIATPKDLYVMQCALLEHKSKPYNPPRGGSEGDSTVVLECTRTVIESLIPALEDAGPDFNPISLEPGKGGAFRIYQMGGSADPDIASGGGFGGTRSTFTQQKDRMIGYGVKCVTEWNGISCDLSGVADMIQAKSKPWDDIIRIMTHEEQAHMLAKHFPADVIWAAFSDHRHEGWIPEHVERAMTQPVSVPVAAVPPQQAPPAPAAGIATTTPPSGWAAAPAASAGAVADPLARPTGQAAEVTDPALAEGGLPVDSIADAMQGGDVQERTREDVVADARRAMEDDD